MSWFYKNCVGSSSHLSYSFETLVMQYHHTINKLDISTFLKIECKGTDIQVSVYRKKID